MIKFRKNKKLALKEGDRVRINGTIVKCNNIAESYHVEISPDFTIHIYEKHIEKVETPQNQAQQETEQAEQHKEPRDWNLLLPSWVVPAILGIVLVIASLVGTNGLKHMQKPPGAIYSKILEGYKVSSIASIKDEYLVTMTGKAGTFIVETKHETPNFNFGLIAKHDFDRNNLGWYEPLAMLSLFVSIMLTVYPLVVLLWILRT